MVPSQLKDALGSLLRTQRTSRKWTVEKAAEKIGCQQTSVVQWENGRNFPGYLPLRKIAQAYELTGDQLLMLDTAQVRGKTRSISEFIDQEHAGKI